MRKTITFVFLSVLLAAVFVGSLGAETQSPAHDKPVVVYFSQTGNTRAASEAVAKELSADVFELKVAKPPAAKGQLPEIEPAKIDLASFSFVVVSSPIWGTHLVPAIQAFLKNNSLRGKNVVVLTTTNAAMPENFQLKHKQLVTDAGGTVAGYYQLVMMEQKDDKPVLRAATDIQKDTMAIVGEIKKVVVQ